MSRNASLENLEDDNNQAAPNKNRRLGVSQSAHQSPVGSSPNKANRKIPTNGVRLTASSASSAGTISMDLSEDDRREELSDREEEQHGRISYNPNTDPENASMHADPFQTPLTNSDTLRPRPNYRVVKSIRTFEPVPLYSIVKVGTIAEERNKGVRFGYDNPHEPLEFSGPPSAEIARRFRKSSLNEGYFHKAVFYPSDIFKGISAERVEEYTSGNYVAIVLFNGGQFMHQELKDTMNDVRTFLEEAGCEDLEINSPFYNDLNPNKEQNTGKGRGRASWRQRGRGGTGTSTHKTEQRNDRYQGRNVAFALIQPPSLRTLILSLQTFALSNILAFHAVEPSKDNMPWVVCILFVTSTKADETMRDRIEHTIRKDLANDGNLSRDLAYCSKVEGTTSDKVQSFIDSTEVRDAGYESTEKRQRCHVWTLYAAPFANSESYPTRDIDERRIRRYISTKQFEMGTIDISELEGT
ncbi:hypothetical protein LENED_007369 [Lentinula edodes]|uniref:Uncharacterized protein n=1 Tax=Lentinula edodes TaxID=5353 RepID=A0A1Q3EE89_LENED|nr:hypothetical protein LENED_007369 [Lentinula edodes]